MLTCKARQFFAGLMLCPETALRRIMYTVRQRRMKSAGEYVMIFSDPGACDITALQAAERGSWEQEPEYV